MSGVSRVLISGKWCKKWGAGTVGLGVLIKRGVDRVLFDLGILDGSGKVIKGSGLSCFGLGWVILLGLWF